MKSLPRTALAAVALLISLPTTASEQWPTRPIRLVVPFAAGGSVDVTARVLAKGLAPRLGQAVVVENRTGAAGFIGTQNVVNSPADGYSIVMASAGIISVAPYLYKDMPFDPTKDLAPITPVVDGVNVLVVRPKSPATTVGAFIDMAKAEPGKLNFGSSGVGASDYMATQLFMAMTDTRMTNISYRGGGPAMVDLLAGNVDFMLSAVAPAVSQIKAGQLRALGVTSSERLEVLPDVPTIAEAGVPGYDSVAWYGLFAPAGTPAAIIDRINRETAEVLKDPGVRKQLVDSGLLPHISSPQEFAAYIAADSKKWGDVVKANDIKVE
ncbi:tripartite tricarboxylate transporter substrate binding protein [Bordetella sp. BOR01]|uniref:Bug family tripartite tricarboxylate transporter substrate binding protein n=1 Tax=Bordetella sp. BOR01 TaxID=2854779 RepID=UPI001C4473E9|nr:tripartite tricarboxylate transporter substrate binding protein [Bordetella sp. BOR01]MBV7481824.1 tripartite tricarboxylate transporter substrate binding protein [Bordetella sp. BOR01]